MIKLNLTRNNIIVIIIIFFCYSIFMLYNTRGIFEKFESSANINRCAGFNEKECNPSRNTDSNCRDLTSKEACNADKTCYWDKSLSSMTTATGSNPGKCVIKKCSDYTNLNNCNSIPNCKWNGNKQKCSRKYNCRWANLDTKSKKCYENAYLAKKLKNLKNFKGMAWDVESRSLNKDGNLFSFEESEQNFKIYNFFCDKLKLLDKPNKNDLIFRRFTNDFIKKKKNHINKLGNQIKTLQEDMFEEDVSKFNTNKLRQHDQADKQYKAIVKGIENVKNRDKINLTLN